LSLSGTAQEPSCPAQAGHAVNAEILKQVKPRIERRGSLSAHSRASRNSPRRRAAVRLDKPDRLIPDRVRSGSADTAGDGSPTG
jgi:hypothetical protein